MAETQRQRIRRVGRTVKKENHRGKIDWENGRRGGGIEDRRPRIIDRIAGVVAGVAAAQRGAQSAVSRRRRREFEIRDRHARENRPHNRANRYERYQEDNQEGGEYADLNRSNRSRRNRTAERYASGARRLQSGVSVAVRGRRGKR